MCDFEGGMVVGGQAVLSISETADILGLSRRTISKLSKKQKIFSEQQLCGQKCFIM